jgi:hypothetical protein
MIATRDGRRSGSWCRTRLPICPHAPESRTCWEELPTEEEMIQVNILLNENAGLSA